MEPARKPERRTARPKAPIPKTPGLAARRWAADLVFDVTANGRSLEGTFDGPGSKQVSNPADIALTQSLVLSTLRHLGTLDAALGNCLDRPLKPSQARAQATLRVLATQLLILDMPAHAAVTLAVEDVAQSPKTRALKGLVNAVGRRMAREGKALLPAEPALEQPKWLAQRWAETYGKKTGDHVLASLRNQPAIDLTPNPSIDREDLLKALAEHGPTLLPTGSIRLANPGRITELPGFKEGHWWVQDVAAALPATILLESLEDPSGATVLDMCAAPGGKTAQLAATGADVTAVDRSQSRMGRLTDNLKRLGLQARTVIGDARAVVPNRHLSAVILDAPCRATGTLRRHPDLAHVRRPDDIVALANLQSELLEAAAKRTAPGGTLVYATCSMEPEEGEDQISQFLAGHPNWALESIDWSDLPARARQADGTVRTLPHMAPASPDIAGGMDGFFIAKLHHHVS
ncbi:MAG: 16S rRNA (cytosine(967)-C(5))-methyltransferase RsmB [Cohaesibacteraceae bacterium]